MSEQKQHVDYHRKILLRQKLLTGNERNVYVPFIGDGDIANEVYGKINVYGADIDKDRVVVASTRIQGKCIVADCNKWPFPNLDVTFDGADFDAYSHPYESFISFWKNANKSDKLTLFFTDGHRQGIKRTKYWIKPDGSREKLSNMADIRMLYNFYLPKFILPWFESFIGSYKIVNKMSYLRKDMLYWGCVICR